MFTKEHYVTKEIEGLISMNTPKAVLAQAIISERGDVAHQVVTYLLENTTRVMGMDLNHCARFAARKSLRSLLEDTIRLLTSIHAPIDRDGILREIITTSDWSFIKCAVVIVDPALTQTEYAEQTECTGFMLLAARYGNANLVEFIYRRMPANPQNATVRQCAQFLLKLQP
jgi:hypothetical protein